MTPRRVRSDMAPRGAQATYPRPALYLVIQRPRVASLCKGRAPLWEWRDCRAVAVAQ